VGGDSQLQKNIQEVKDVSIEQITQLIKSEYEEHER